MHCRPRRFKLVGERQAPLSSLTWQLNLLTPAARHARTAGGCSAPRADYASGGSSSQGMTIWNADGEPVAEAMQSVAIFG